MNIEAWSTFGLAWQIDEPFWGALFASLPRSEDYAVRSIALKPLGETAIQLAFHPGRTELQTEIQLRSAIKHELIHLLLGHPFYTGVDVLNDFYSIACDLEVQGSLIAGESGLHEMVQTHFPELADELNSPAGEFAILLQALWRKEVVSGKNSPKWDFFEKNLRSALDSHLYWPELKRKSSKLLPWFQQWKREALQQKKSLKTGFSAWFLEKTAELQKTDTSYSWRYLLHRFIAGSHKTHLKNTLHRSSRRFGTRPGTKIVATPQIWIAVDTSGSMRTDDLSVFFQSLESVYRRGIKLTVLECDTEIRRRYPFIGKTPADISGRGNTRWDSVLEAAAQERPDGLIYFTDGLSSPPGSSYKFPVLWLIAPQGIAPGEGVWNSLPGRVVKMM